MYLVSRSKFQLVMSFVLCDSFCGVEISSVPKTCFVWESEKTTSASFLSSGLLLVTLFRCPAISSCTDSPKGVFSYPRK